MPQEFFGGSTKKHQTPKDPGAVFLEDGYLTGIKEGKKGAVNGKSWELQL